MNRSERGGGVVLKPSRTEAWVKFSRSRCQLGKQPAIFAKAGEEGGKTQHGQLLGGNRERGGRGRRGVKEQRKHRKKKS